MSAIATGAVRVAAMPIWLFSRPFEPLPPSPVAAFPSLSEESWCRVSRHISREPRK